MMSFESSADRSSRMKKDLGGPPRERCLRQLRELYDLLGVDSFNRCTCGFTAAPGMCDFCQDAERREGKPGIEPFRNPEQLDSEPAEDRHLAERAKDCRCCPSCSGVPCAGCQQGAGCDHMICDCNQLIDDIKDCAFQAGAVDTVEECDCQRCQEEANYQEYLAHQGQDKAAQGDDQ